MRVTVRELLQLVSYYGNSLESLCLSRVQRRQTGAVQQTRSLDSHPQHGGETDQMAGTALSMDNYVPPSPWGLPTLLSAVHQPTYSNVNSGIRPM